MNEKREYLELKKVDGTRFYIKKELLRSSKESLETLLQDETYLHTREFAKKAMLFHEIKSNNEVEGYKDDIETIRDAIKNAESIHDPQKRARILNLYNAYLYILKIKKMDKERLRHLYNLTSKDVLSQYEQENMGEYYRSRTVYILNGGRLDTYPDEGVPEDRIEQFMDAYFNFLENYTAENETDEYIKSQILHFYFVYIHPYFDVNGRTSRTLAMWYLLNKKAYPYIIFNRGISFSGSSYDKSIIGVKNTNNLTPFIKFMLDTVQKELEKEYVIHTISGKIKPSLTPTEYQALLYFITMKGQKSIFDFANFYNTRHDHKKVTEIYQTMLEPLLDKGVLDIERESSKECQGIRNKILSLRPIDINPEKIRNLKM